MSRGHGVNLKNLYFFWVGARWQPRTRGDAVNVLSLPSSVDRAIPFFSASRSIFFAKFVSNVRHDPKLGFGLARDLHPTEIFDGSTQQLKLHRL